MPFPLSGPKSKAEQELLLWTSVRTRDSRGFLMEKSYILHQHRNLTFSLKAFQEAFTPGDGEMHKKDREP